MNQGQVKNSLPTLALIETLQMPKLFAYLNKISEKYSQFTIIFQQILRD